MQGRSATRTGVQRGPRCSIVRVPGAGRALRRVGASFGAQARAPNVLCDPPEGRVPASDLGLIVWSLVLVVPLVALLRIVLSSQPISDDGALYRALADDPIDNPLIVNSLNPFHVTFALRLLVPVTVWALPFGTTTGFHLTSIGGIVAGAVIVALIARRIGLGPLALLAGPVYVATFHAIYGLWQMYHVDTVTLALFSAGVLAAYTYRAVFCSLLAALVVASKEIGLALPFAWYASRRRSCSERRALAEAVVVAAFPLTVFVTMRYTQLIPHRSWHAWQQYQLGFTTQGEWGYVRPLVQVFVQNHGMLWLLWPLGVLAGPPRWRRLNLFVLILVPFLAGGPWARSCGYLLPFVIPSGLVALSRISLVRASIALVGSAAVAVPLALRNIALEQFQSNLLLLPGALVFGVAALPAITSLLSDVRLHRPGRRLGRRAT